MKKNIVLLAISALFIFLSSCNHEPDLTNLKAISYTNDIQPMLASNCTMSECHSSNGGEFSLMTYDEVISNGEVEAGKAHGSKLYKAVTAIEGNDAMPPSPRAHLSDEQLTKIYLWIEQGAKNN